MKKAVVILLGSFLISLLSISCNNAQENKQKQEEINQPQSAQADVDIRNTEGYKLLAAKCYVCHFEKPDPSKRDKMIAPPMLRVKEHYLPVYPNKKDFVAAIVDIVKNPSEEKTLMPGTVKKFNLMPKLKYDDHELQLIAETIYNYKFDKAPRKRMKMQGELMLNNGETWKLKKETIDKIESLIKKTTAFNSEKIEDYNRLGKNLFEESKFIMLDKSYTGEKFNQIHNFFQSIEEDMHALMTEKSIEKAKDIVKKLNTKLSEFNQYFAAE